MYNSWKQLDSYSSLLDTSTMLAVPELHKLKYGLSLQAKASTLILMFIGLKYCVSRTPIDSIERKIHIINK